MNYDYRVSETARAILHKKIGIIEGSRHMVFLRSELGLYDDKTLHLFLAIDSQTDHVVLDMEKFPMSDSRKKENLKDIEEYESFYKDAVEKACRQILNDSLKV